MGYLTNGLSFRSLRGANVARLPQFRSKTGAPAHRLPDGSDWPPAMWLMAVAGELGELARVRSDYEFGLITRADYERFVRQESADVVTYLDLFANRALDDVPRQSEERPQSIAQVFVDFLATVGEYANMRKKLVRGDFHEDEFPRDGLLAAVRATLFTLIGKETLSAGSLPLDPVADHVIEAHPFGIDLGEAVTDTFNLVSERVGSNVMLDADDWRFTNPLGKEV